MPSTTPSDVWADRWSWAADAVENVRGRLAPELRHLVGTGSTEVSVVLYGPTQVGKSTLLLTLLGVADEHRREVARVLGARGSGRSATASPMRYRWSSRPDDWEFTTNGRSLRCTPDEMRERLAERRRALDAGAGDDPARPITIGLPGGCRGTRSATVPHVLDLPGIDGEEDAERVAARRMMQRHVPLADLVVLVVEAGKMSKLAEALDRPELDWLAWPGRFRLVLTYSVTRAYGDDRAFRDRVDPITPDEFRAVALTQLETYLPPGRLDEPDLRARIAAILYPIEYGKTWAEQATDRERAVFGLAIAALIDDLEQQVDHAAVDDGRYVALPRAAHAIRSHYERVLAEIADRADLARTARDRTAAHLDCRTTTLGEAAAAASRAEELHGLADTCAHELTSLRVAPAPPTEPAERGRCQFDEQRTAVRDALRGATTSWRRGTATRLSEAAGCPLPAVAVPDTAAYAALAVAHEVEPPCWDGQPWVLTLFQLRCHEQLGMRWAALCDDLTAKLRTALGAWLATARQQLPRLDEVNGRLVAARAAVERTQRDLAAAEARITAIAAEHTACAAEAHRAEQTAALILAEVDRQWQRHLRRLYRQVAATRDAATRERLTLAALLAYHLRDRIGDG